MRRFSIFLSLTITLLCTAAHAGGKDIMTADCRSERTTKITFSTRLQKDVLHVTAVGSPCIKGIVNVKIIKEGEKVIYDESLKIENLYVDPAGVPANDIENVVDRIIKDGPTTTDSWPSFVGKPQPVDVGGEYTYTVSKNEYERLRTKKLPAFQLGIYYDVYTNLIYDAKKDKAVVIWEWGL